MSLVGPPAADRQISDDLAVAVGGLSNDDLRLVVLEFAGPDKRRLVGHTFRFRPDSAAIGLSRRIAAGRSEAFLLRALEDDARVAVAHVLLAGATRFPGRANRVGESGDEIEVIDDVLRMHVRRPPNGSSGLQVRELVFEFGHDGVRMSPGTAAEVRAAWHARLDVELAAVPIPLVVMLGLITPAIWAGRRVRGARRRAGGRCVRCGYDLRGGHSACPECGTSLSDEHAERVKEAALP